MTVTTRVEEGKEPQIIVTFTEDEANNIIAGIIAGGSDAARPHAMVSMLLAKTLPLNVLNIAMADAELNAPERAAAPLLALKLLHAKRIIKESKP